jgi:hypothetical protein
VKKITSSALTLALAASLLALGGSSSAQESAGTQFFLHWDVGCTGETSTVDESGIMDFTDRPSEDNCVLFFPGITPPGYGFRAEEGVPFRLDATKPVGVRFLVFAIAHAAVTFEFSVTGKIGGTATRIAGGSTTIIAGALQDNLVEVALPVDPALDGAEVSALTFIIGQTQGVSYSQMDLTNDNAWIEVARQDQPAPDPSPSPSPSPTPSPTPTGPAEPEPTAVVAFIDTGINPYHVAYRDTSALAYQHPSTYIPGYPADAEALNLTLDADTYSAAVKADCEVWKSVKPGRLYWIPGTKIVGAISFELPLTSSCKNGNPAGTYILDSAGHGTMTSSRGAAALDYGACRACRIVAIQAPLYVPLLDPHSTLQPNIDAIRFAANNAHWIDAQSNSWGPIAPVWEPTGQGGLLGGTPQLVRAVEEVSSKHLAFWASGNGAAFRYGVLGHPTIAASHLTPSAIIVGAHDSGYVTTWPGFSPHVISDGCASWAAKFNHLSESGDSVGSGTSAATPFAAGGAAQILLEARRILGDLQTGVDDGVVARGTPGLVSSGPLADGTFTKDEWKRLVYVSATPRPTAQYEDGPPCGVEWTPYNPTPVKWSDVPSGYPEYVQIGYGAVDRPSIALAGKILRGEAAAPDRSATDQYFVVDGTARRATYEVWSRP